MSRRFGYFKRITFLQPLLNGHTQVPIMSNWELELLMPPLGLFDVVVGLINVNLCAVSVAGVIENEVIDKQLK